MKKYLECELLESQLHITRIHVYEALLQKYVNYEVNTRFIKDSKVAVDVLGFSEIYGGNEKVSIVALPLFDYNVQGRPIISVFSRYLSEE